MLSLMLEENSHCLNIEKMHLFDKHWCWRNRKGRRLGLAQEWSWSLKLLTCMWIHWYSSHLILAKRFSFCPPSPPPHLNSRNHFSRQHTCEETKQKQNCWKAEGARGERPWSSATCRVQTQITEGRVQSQPQSELCATEPFLLKAHFPTTSPSWRAFGHTHTLHTPTFTHIHIPTHSFTLTHAHVWARSHTCTRSPPVLCPVSLEQMIRLDFHVPWLRTDPLNLCLQRLVTEAKKWSRRRKPTVGKKLLLPQIPDGLHGGEGPGSRFLLRSALVGLTGVSWLVLKTDIDHFRRHHQAEIQPGG